MSPDSQNAWLRSFLVSVAALLVLPCLEAPRAGADDRVVTVGVYENEPKIFTAASGKPSGIFIDVIEHVASMEGWKVRYVRGTWAKGLERLERGEIDLMPDVAYTAEREKTYAFHKIPVLSGWSQVYARKNSGIQSILDLGGKRVIALEQTIQLETFRRLANSFELKITLVPVPDYKTGFEMVAGGKADAVVTNRFYGLAHARKFGLEDTPVMFDPAPFFFAARKDGPRRLLDVIDRHLAALKKDPRSAYYAAMKRWTSDEVQFKFPAWMKVLGIVLVATSLVSLAGGFVLKHQVNARTRELKQTNVELETHRLHLEEMVKARTAELEAANAKLRELDRLKSLFIASMSHELRTPLNSIIGFTGILLQGFVGPLNEEQRKQLGMVKGSSLHLLDLITDIIDLSKIEAGKIELALGDFDLVDVAREVAASLAPAAERKGIAIVLDGADSLGARSDKRRIRQVLVNLAGNAVKFTESGEVRITVSEHDGVARAAVRDTGPGIREEDMGRLFQFFSQIASPDGRRHEGTGLGLYLSKKLMHVLGGDVLVESRFGVGSVFTMVLPLIEKESR